MAYRAYQGGWVIAFFFMATSKFTTFAWQSNEKKINKFLFTRETNIQAKFDATSAIYIQHVINSTRFSYYWEHTKRCHCRFLMLSIYSCCLGREVVFQCRDEGPIRARVQWTRKNGRPLPQGSRDFNGRLEIPNILIEHSGEYICEAIGYAKTTPGATVSVHLTVEKCKLQIVCDSPLCKLD